MSVVIKSLFINALNISFTSDYVMDAFYCQDIATISRVALVPYESKSGLRYKAFIDIHEWHASEAAYNFIQRLRDPNREARIVHNDDNWWVVEVNKKPFITNSKKMAKFTTINYLVTPISEEDCLPWMLYGCAREEENEWKEIQKELSEMLLYQNLEYELCL